MCIRCIRDITSILRPSPSRPRVQIDAWVKLTCRSFAFCRQGSTQPDEETKGIIILAVPMAKVDGKLMGAALALCNMPTFRWVTNRASGSELRCAVDRAPSCCSHKLRNWPQLPCTDGMVSLSEIHERHRMICHYLVSPFKVKLAAPWQASNMLLIVAPDTIASVAFAESGGSWRGSWPRDLEQTRAPQH